MCFTVIPSPPCRLHKRKHIYIVVLPRWAVVAGLLLGGGALVYLSSAVLTLSWAILLGGWRAGGRDELLLQHATAIWTCPRTRLPKHVAPTWGLPRFYTVHSMPRIDSVLLGRSGEGVA